MPATLCAELTSFQPLGSTLLLPWASSTVVWTDQSKIGSTNHADTSRRRLFPGCRQLLLPQPSCKIELDERCRRGQIRRIWFGDVPGVELLPVRAYAYLRSQYHRIVTPSWRKALLIWGESWRRWCHWPENRSRATLVGCERCCGSDLFWRRTALHRTDTWDRHPLPFFPTFRVATPLVLSPSSERSWSVLRRVMLGCSFRGRLTCQP